jgi:hypothetical protein
MTNKVKVYLDSERSKTMEKSEKLGDRVCGEKAEVVEERGNEDKKNLTRY